MEKGIYCLLMRYQQNRLKNYRSDCVSPNPQGSKTMTKSTPTTMKPESRNSLTNKPGVAFPRPSQKPQPKVPAKSGLPPNPTDTALAKKPLLENKASGNTLPYPRCPPKCPPTKQRNSPVKTVETPPSYPMNTVIPKGQASPKIPTSPVAAATARLNAKPLGAPAATNEKKGKENTPVELSPNKQAITRQFATEIEKAFNQMPRHEKNGKPNVTRHDMLPRDVVRRPTYHSVRPLPLIPMRRALVPLTLRSPQVMGPRSPDLSTQELGNWSDSPTISRSVASAEIYQDIFQDLFADAPDDDSSASSYDLTKPLRISPSKQRLVEKKSELPVLPFRPGRPLPPNYTTTTPLIIQKEASTLRISSFVTPPSANPLLAVPTLDKRNISAPVPRIPPLTSPILVDKDFETQRPPLVQQRTGIRREFFKEGSLRLSDISNDQPFGEIDTGVHPLQARMNSMKDPAPVRRKWSSRLRPGETKSNFLLP